jgi:general stress protein YciG
MEDGPKARLVDAATFDGRAVSTTIPRSEFEEALEAGGPTELDLDLTRGDFEAHTVRVQWDHDDLEALLERTKGGDVTLTFDGSELEQALEPDVEAQGLREKALILTVAAAAVTGGVASQASAHPQSVGMTAHQALAQAASEGVDPSTGLPAQTELVSDSASSGPVQQAAATPQLVSDAASSGGFTQAAAESPQLVSDAASSGGFTQAAAESPQLVSDAASSGGFTQAAAESTQLVSDAASSGGYATPTAEASSGGGFSIPTPDPGETAAIAGGLALLITGAGFVIRGQRRREPRPA